MQRAAKDLAPNNDGQLAVKDLTMDNGVKLVGKGLKPSRTMACIDSKGSDAEQWHTTTAMELALNSDAERPDNEQWLESGGRVSDSEQWGAMTAKDLTPNNEVQWQQTVLSDAEQRAQTGDKRPDAV